jgi:hypothetical protein
MVKNKRGFGLCQNPLLFFDKKDKKQSEREILAFATKKPTAPAHGNKYRRKRRKALQKIRSISSDVSTHPIGGAHPSGKFGKGGGFVSESD